MSIELLVLLSAGLITGFSKFSVGGMGLLILPVIMIVFPGPQALGIIIPMYLITDLLAISSYRKNINWRLLAKLLPLCFAGILIGSWFLSHLDAKQFSWMLATIILGMLVLGFVLDRLDSNVLRHPMSAMLIGFLGGVVSMISNAAGPLFSIYFLEQKLTKQAYVSTRSWAFMLINICKIPILLSMGLLTYETALISLQAVPGLVIGAFLGYWLLGKLQLTQFKWLIRIMASIAALKLMIG
ncbi:MAG: hypothetical protein OFPII_26860 [Osedax symbiont Rs1]|nr:MAG: hypothetical protein OFPII_26860 [Osedax symbiont Rs1]